MSVSVLASWSPPAGSPDAAASAASEQGRASALHAAAASSARAASHQLANSGWSGWAADAWAASASAPLHAIAATADAEELCAVALRGWADVLVGAQATWRQAESLAEADLADQRLIEAEQAAHPLSPLVAPPGCGPAGPFAPCGVPVPVRPDASWPPPSLLAEPGEVAFGDPSPASRRPHAEPAYRLGARAITEALEGEDLLVTALAGIAEALESGRRDLDAATRRPNWAQRNLGTAGDFLTGFADAAGDAATQVGGLASGDGATYSQLAGAIPQAVEDPGGTLKAVVGWDELSQGHFARWGGGITFSVGAAVVSAGATEVVRGLDAVQALARRAERIPPLSDRIPMASVALRDRLGRGALGTKPEGGAEWRRRVAWDEGPGNDVPPHTEGGPSQPRVDVDGVGNPVRDGGVAVPSDYPSATVLDESTVLHILDGEITSAGKPSGGHRSGVGNAYKSEFPPSWSERDIVEHVVDISRHPRAGRWEPINGGLDHRVWDVRDGVTIEVLVRRDGHILTAYPVSGPGVIRNPKVGKR